MIDLRFLNLVKLRFITEINGVEKFECDKGQFLLLRETLPLPTATGIIIMTKLICL
jgi:hypothetical protein